VTGGQWSSHDALHFAQNKGLGYGWHT
jgi:hypothetical protein